MVLVFLQLVDGVGDGVGGGAVVVVVVVLLLFLLVLFGALLALPLPLKPPSNARPPV